MCINKRLEIIISQSGMSKSEFAAMMGWSKPYLSQLLRENSGVGLTPIIAIAEKMPDIDLRWLITGKESAYNGKEAKRACYLMSIEKYICVMSQEELSEYEKAIYGDTSIYFCKERIDRWENLLSQRKKIMDKLLEKAMKGSVVSGGL